MSEFKYKVGDKVRIKSIGWYNENKDEYGCIDCGSRAFFAIMCQYCGKILTINSVDDFDKKYKMTEDGHRFDWTDEMIEGLVEEKSQPKFNIGDVVYSKTWQHKAVIREIFPYGFYAIGELYGTGWVKAHEDTLSKEIVKPTLLDKLTEEYTLPDGYIFKDENGNEIHALKIVLEKANTLKTQSDNMETETRRGYCTTEEDTTNKNKKVAWFSFWGNDFADKVELDLSNRELIQEDGKWFVVKKGKEYPKTYEECYQITGLSKTSDIYGYKNGLLFEFQKLLIARNAYWQIAGDEMGLGKPWEPSKDKMAYSIYRHRNEIKTDFFSGESVTFEFPTEKMRDDFKKNFDKDIEFCKELL